MMASEIKRGKRISMKKRIQKIKRKRRRRRNHLGGSTISQKAEKIRRAVHIHTIAIAKTR